MGTKPNWGGAASALGNALFQYGMAKDRQKFTEQERRAREQAILERQMKIRELINADRIAAEERAAQAAAEELDRTNPYYLPPGAMLPDGTPAFGAGMRLSEVADRARIKSMLTPEETAPTYSYQIPGGPLVEGLTGAQRMTQHRYDNPNQDSGSNLVPFTDEQGNTYMLTPYQAYRANNQEPDPFAEFLMRQAERDKSAEEKEQREEERRLINRLAGGVYSDVMTRLSPADPRNPSESDWSQTGEHGVFTRMVDDHPNVPFWGDREETTTLADEAAAVLASRLSDGDISDIDYKIIHEAAGRLNVRGEDIVRAYDPALIAKWREINKNPLTQEQKDLIESLTGGK